MTDNMTKVIPKKTDLFSYVFKSAIKKVISHPDFRRFRSNYPIFENWVAMWDVVDQRDKKQEGTRDKGQDVVKNWVRWWILRLIFSLFMLISTFFRCSSLESTRSQSYTCSKIVRKSNFLPGFTYFCHDLRDFFL